MITSAKLRKELLKGQGVLTETDKAMLADLTTAEQSAPNMDAVEAVRAVGKSLQEYDFVGNVYLARVLKTVTALKQERDEARQLLLAANQHIADLERENRQLQHYAQDSV